MPLKNYFSNTYMRNSSLQIAEKSSDFELVRTKFPKRNIIMTGGGFLTDRTRTLDVYSKTFYKFWPWSKIIHNRNSFDSKKIVVDILESIRNSFVRKQTLEFIQMCLVWP